MTRQERFVRRIDGTITIDTGGYRYHCRQIRLGEYVALRSDVDHVTDYDLVAGWVVRAVAMLSGWWIHEPPAWFTNEDLPALMIEHWRGWPIPLFEKVQPVDPRQRMRQRPEKTSKAAGIYKEIAPIYEALATRGITPPYDHFPLWEIAAMLGLHNPPEGSDQIDWASHRSLGRGDPVGPANGAGNAPSASPGPSMGGQGAPLDPKEVLRRRVEAAEAGRPAPKWSDEEMAIGARTIANELTGAAL